jgi:transglutaminase-like putative cysteine protease
MLRNRRGRSQRSATEDAPDDRQVIAATLILGIALLPLLPALDLRVDLFIGAAVAWRLVAVRFPQLQPGTPILLILTLAGGLIVLEAYRGITGQAPGTALLLSMVSLKLLEARGKRDLRVLMLVLGFVLVVQFLFDDSPLRALLMTAILIGSFALLLDLNLPSRPARLLPRARFSLRGAGLMAAQALPLAIVLFVLFPRLSAPLWNLGLDNPHAISGLKDWLEPGSIKDLVVSGEPVMRVRFDSEPNIPAEEMYWRGPVLWHAVGNRFIPARPGDFPDAEPKLRPLSEPLSYSVMLEPNDQRWITALDAPLAAPRRASLTPDLQLLADKPIEDRSVFRVRSAYEYRAEGMTLDEESAALALPLTVTRRMRELVDGWTADEPSAQQVVDRALNYFNEQPFRYSLLAPDMGDRPMDAFLFDERVGFCEHYSASFTLLMRLAGIPTRIVLGYLGGERNRYSDDFLIRQSDAHAWTEVWIDGEGWTRVDPTAAVDPARVDRDSRIAAMGAGAPVRFRLDESSMLVQALHNVRLAADALNVTWQRWVIGFSRDQQQRLLMGLGLGELGRAGLVLLMAVAGAIVLLSWTFWLARKQPPRDPVVAAYRDFQRRLRRAGTRSHAAWAKAPWTTSIGSA